MLTKKDGKDIKNIVTDSLGEFFEDILVPYLDREHKENQKEHQELGDKIDLINEHLKDHEKRISKLENITSVI